MARTIGIIGNSKTKKSTPAKTQNARAGLLWTINNALYWLFGDLGPGPAFIKMNWIINFQKGGSIFFYFFLMWYYNNWSLGAWMLNALHGGYGIIWIIKDITFPDMSFQRRQKLIPATVLTAYLAAYWYIGWLQIAGFGIENPSPARLYLCIVSWGIGVALMMSADAQKWYILDLLFRHESVRKEISLI